VLVLVSQYDLRLAEYDVGYLIILAANLDLLVARQLVECGSETCSKK